MISDSSVLATKKDIVDDKNRKDYATDKWEAEVRNSIKSKAPTGKVSKADQALVTAQLAKEADVRRHLQLVQGRLRRGVELIAALVAAKSSVVERHIVEMARLMLSSVFGPGNFLMDRRPFDVFLVSSTIK